MKFAYCLHIALVIVKYTDVYRGCFSGEGRGGGSGKSHRRSFHRGIFMGGWNFPWGWAHFPAFFKNDQKLYKKMSFF